MESHESSFLNDGRRREAETQLFSLGSRPSFHLGLSCPGCFVHGAAVGRRGVSRGDDLSERGAGWRGSFLLGKTSLCLFSGFRAWPGAVQTGPLSSEGLWRPRLLISRFSSFKGSISFQRGEFICKAPCRSRRQIPAQLACRGGFFMAGPVLGAILSFVC